MVVDLFLAHLDCKVYIIFDQSPCLISCAKRSRDAVVSVSFLYPVLLQQPAYGLLGYAKVEGSSPSGNITTFLLLNSF